MENTGPTPEESAILGQKLVIRTTYGGKCSFFVDIKLKARAVVGRGEEDPLCDPGSELLLGGNARGVGARIIDGMGRGGDGYKNSGPCTWK